MKNNYKEGEININILKNVSGFLIKNMYDTSQWTKRFLIDKRHVVILNQFHLKNHTNLNKQNNN